MHLDVQRDTASRPCAPEWSNAAVRRSDVSGYCRGNR